MSSRLGMLCLLVGCLAVLVPVLFQVSATRNALDNADEVLRLANSSQPGDPGFAKKLSECIDECSAAHEQFPGNKRIFEKLWNLLSERSHANERLKNFDAAVADIDRMIAINKGRDDIQSHSLAMLYKVHVLKESGSPKKAIQVCKDLIKDVGSRNATYRAYANLVQLVKATPDADPQDVALLDEYRRMATLLARGDWKEQ